MSTGNGRGHAAATLSVIRAPTGAPFDVELALAALVDVAMAASWGHGAYDRAAIARYLLAHGVSFTAPDGVIETVGL